MLDAPILLESGVPMPSNRDADFNAFLIGFAGGLRSATPMATIAHAVNRGRLNLPAPLSRLGAPRVTGVLGLSRAGEWVADKLPITPSRLELRSLVVRASAGAFYGAVVEVANGRPWWRGAILGKLGALAGSYAGYQARMFFTHVTVQAAERHKVPPAVAQVAVAAVEDAAAVALSSYALRQKQPAKTV